MTPICTHPDDKFTQGTARRLLRNELGRESVCGKPPECPVEPRQEKPTS